MAGPLPEGDALLHGGRQGTSELGGVLHQGVIACRHHGVETRFEVPQLAELTDDAMADFLKYVCHVGIAGRLDREKAGRASLIGTIQIDPLQEDEVEMEIGVRRRLYLIV